MSKFNVGDRVVLSKKSARDSGVPKQLSLDTVYTVSSVELGRHFEFLHVKSDSGDVSGRWLEERFEMANEEYIVWCPDSKQPPTVRFKSKDRATEVAKKMASQNTAQKFYVCKLCAYAESPKPETQVVDL